MTAMTPMGRTTSTAAPGGTPPLVVVAHGSRDPRALSTVRALLDRVRALRPGLPVHLGHIELNEPLLPDTLAALGDGAAVLTPSSSAAATTSNGTSPRWPRPPRPAPAWQPPRPAPAARGRPPRPPGAGRLACSRGAGPRGRLASAGSRDPDSRTDTARTAALLSARIGAPVVPAYASAAAPTVPEAVRALEARGYRNVAVASYFTSPGRFATERAAAALWIASPPLGTHPAMARLLLHRYDQALVKDGETNAPEGARDASTCGSAAWARPATTYAVLARQQNPAHA